ncbi:MAG: FAD:protein FMN transferase [Oscillospiraceae bacterium]|nr:FAD:protein FMN transferase [Oscillospiraceae bacterium]
MKHTSTCCKILLLLLCLLLSFTACKGEQKVTKQIFAMDTYMELTAYGDNADVALTGVINTINQTAMDWDPELEKSTVYAMNHAEGAPIVVSPEIADMLNTAKTVYDQTGGALDLTVYPIVKAWGFIDSKHTVPTADELETLKSVPCFDEIDVDIHTVTMPAGTELSFGAVAKGAMAERCALIVKDYGIKSAFLSLGGNVQTIGLKPDGSNWRIGVQDPNNLSGYLGIVSIGEKAVVTSGSYQRFFEADGKTYHHIIDPETAAPAESGLVSVTIICDSGTMADSLSTAMFILGEDDAIDYRSTYGGFDMILVTDDDRVIVVGDVEFEESADRYTYEYVK